jgi:hypothetical protein
VEEVSLINGRGPGEKTSIFSIETVHSGSFLSTLFKEHEYVRSAQLNHKSS